MERTRVLLIACQSLWLTSTAIAQPLITALGNGTDPHGLSADGTTIVGRQYLSSAYRGFRWTSAEGLQYLTSDPGVAPSGVSGDGSGVCGTVLGVRQYAFRWTAAEGVVDIGIPPNRTWSSGYAISDDGSVVIGACGSGSGSSVGGFRWTALQGIVEIPVPAGTNRFTPIKTNADGTMFVGSIQTSGLTQACRWTNLDGIQMLSSLAPGESAEALSLNPSGSVAVGYSTIPGSGRRAVRWTDEGVVALGTIPNQSWSWANDVTASGSVIVGGALISSENCATVWTPEEGHQPLNGWLAGRGVDTTGWSLSTAEAISDDGTTIMGHGYFGGVSTGWVVTNLPAPSTSVVAFAAIFSVARRRRSDNRSSTGGRRHA